MAFFAILLLSPAGIAAETLPVARDGVLDLRTWDLARESVPLDGEWDFFWKQLVSAPYPAKTLASLPGYWTTDPTLPANGWATYHLHILLPVGTAATHQVLGLKVTEVLTAFRLSVDGRPVFANGTVGTDEKASIPQYLPGVVFVSPTRDVLDVEIQISNFHYRKGGIWYSPVLGLGEKVHNEWFLASQLNLFLIGGLVIMAIYHMVLWLLRRGDLSPLYFGLFCLIILSRVLFTGDQLMSQWWPGFDWEWGRRLEFLPLCLGAICFLYFIRSLFPECVGPKIFYSLIAVGGLFTAAVLVLPVALSNELVMIMQVVLMFDLIWLFTVVGFAVKRGLPGARLIVLGSLVLFVTIVNDILYAQQVIYTGYFMPLGFFVFVLLHAIILSVKFADSFQRSEHLAEELQQANTSFRRFVPLEFLQNLKRASITEIALGDQVQRDMTVMFADIRSFTTLSESMTPRETFNFLNSYLKRMGPVIRQHGGFIDKFIGDGLLALFPARVEEALDASVTMYTLLQEYNQQRQSTGYPPVGIGIALNYGTLILGTIGEADRMETTVIADAVNVASRLESLSKFYGPGILLPEALLSQLSQPGRYASRHLDVVRIRGRQEPIALVQVLSGQPEPAAASLGLFLEHWEAGIAAYRAGDLDAARRELGQCQALWPDDVAGKLLLRRLNALPASTEVSQWSAVMDWNQITNL